MNIHEVITKLVGPIKPIGETQTDNDRFENLKIMIDLVDKLLSDIDEIIHYKDRQEYSMKRAGEYADKAFDRFGIEE